MRRRQPELAHEEQPLRETMRQCCDELRSRISRGYGDERNRMQLEALRKKAAELRTKDPELWAAVAAESSNA